MSATDTSEERKIWLDFLKEVKNSQYNKLNSSSIKIGTIVAFMATTIIFIINGLPSVKPSTTIVYYLLIIINFLMGAFIVSFNVFNNLFRKDLIIANTMEKYCNIKYQYMFPYIAITMFQIIIWIVLNSLITILFFQLKYLYISLFLPSIVYFALGIAMLSSTAKSFNYNYLEMEQPIINKKNYFVKALNICGPISILYYLISFYCSGFIFSNKELFIYAFYFFGLILASNFFARHLSYRIINSWIDRIYIELFLGASVEEVSKEINSNIKSINDLDTVTYQKNNFVKYLVK